MEDPPPTMTELEETISRCFYGMLPSLSLYCGSVLFNVYMDFRRKELRAKSAKPPTGRVSKVTARLGEHINSITFHFSDDTSVTYGTEEGNVAAAFELEEEEFIVKLLLRSSFFVDTVQFVTNTGRKSIKYSGSARNYFGSHSELALHGIDRAIGGFEFEQSVQGWLKSIYAVFPLNEVDTTPPPPKQHVLEGGVVGPFREQSSQTQRRWWWMALQFCMVFFWAASPVVNECLRNPQRALDDSPAKVVCAVLVNAMFTAYCIYLLTNGTHVDVVAKLLMPYVDQQDKLASVDDNIRALVKRIDTQVLDDQHCTLLDWQYRVFITPHWLIKAGASSLDIVSVDDARILESRVHTELYCGEQIDIITLLVQSRSTLRQFTIQLLQSQYEKFEKSFVDVVQKYREKEAEGAEEAFKAVFDRLLLEKHRKGVVYTREEWHPDQCLGECGLPPTVCFVKSCATCEERDECKCEPMWCHQCILKWWFVNNRTKTEMAAIQPKWQTRCPSCRVYFCLEDIVPRQDIHRFI